MALRLGLEFAGDPRWFHRLSRDEQVDVMAYDRIRHAARQPGANKPGAGRP